MKEGRSESGLQRFRYSRTTKTGQWACLTTESETLPIKARLIPPRPLLPSTISPAPIYERKAAQGVTPKAQHPRRTSHRRRSQCRAGGPDRQGGADRGGAEVGARLGGQLMGLLRSGRRLPITNV